MWDLESLKNHGMSLFHNSGTDVVGDIAGIAPDLVTVVEFRLSCWCDLHHMRVVYPYV